MGPGKEGNTKTLDLIIFFPPWSPILPGLCCHGEWEARVQLLVALNGAPLFSSALRAGLAVTKSNVKS